MHASSSSPPDADTLMRRVLELSVPLHRAIAHFDEPGASYAIAAAPGVGFFTRDAGNTVSHVSSSPSPELLPALEDLAERHLRMAGVAEGTGNSHVPALLLLCMFLADEDSAARLDLRDLARKPASIVALDEEEGRHDPELEPHDAALRAWTPLAAGHVPEAGVHTAVLEMVFHLQRKPRYAPW